MPVTIDATVNSPTANSYVTLAEANAYVSERLFSTAWSGAASDDVRSMALITATQRLDHETWQGSRTTSTQRLAWGRAGVWVDENTLYVDGQYYNGYVDPNTIPVPIKYACIETAIDLLTTNTDAAARDALSKFASIKVGSIAISLKDSAPVNADALRPTVWRLIAPFMGSTQASFDRG